MSAASPRFAAGALRTTVAELAVRAGLAPDMARAMALRVVDADLLGQRTHGLLFFPAYLDRLGKGAIAKSGEYDVVSDTGPVFAWRANRLAGAWMMERATEALIERAAKFGVVSATIAACSHIGCLQAYLLPFTARGLVVTIAATNPGFRTVAPFGGIDPVLTSNPIAYGLPTSGDPILIDYSTSLASNAFFNGFAARGETLPGRWLLDSAGHPTDDPAAINAKPPATILPLGGLEFGYKGFGAGLFVEAVSLGLSGYGRAEPHDLFGQSVFIQVMDPAVFAGRERFLKEMDNLVAECKASRPRPGTNGVRLPGERALASMADQLANGVTIGTDALAKVRPWADQLGVALPEPMP